MRDLKERLEALADEGHPRGATEVMRRAHLSVEDAGGRTRVRRSLVPLVAAAAAAGVVVGAVVAVQRSGDNGPSVVAEGGDDEQPGAQDPPGDQTLFLVPTVVPQGFELIRAAGGERLGASAGGGGTGTDWRQHYVRFDTAQEHPVEILDLVWATDARFDDLLNPPPGAIGVTVRGHDGWYSAELGWLVWEEPVGQRVTIQGTVAPAGPTEPRRSLPLDFLQTVAEALEPRDGDGFDLPDPPGAFELVAEAPGEYSEGTNLRTLTYRGPDDRGFELQLVDGSDLPPGMRLYNATDRIVDVRGKKGVLTSSVGAIAGGTYDEETRFISERTDRTLTWLERSNVKATLNGVGMSDSELLMIAENLEPVDAQTWVDLESQIPSGTDDPNDIEPSRLRVLVWNAGAQPGSASALSNALRATGYNVLVPEDAPLTLATTGDAVQCRDPFAGAAAALALTVRSGGESPRVEPFAEPPPGSGAEAADCIVYLGA